MLDYSYLPKEQSISCRNTHRAAGYVPGSIHMHDHHEITLILTDCACQIISNGNILQIHAPAVLLNRAGSFHEVIEVLSGDFKSRVIFFHPQLAQDLPASLYAPALFENDLTAITLEESQLSALLPLLDLLEQKDGAQKTLLLLTVLAQLTELAHTCATITVCARQTYILDVISAIQNRYEEKLSSALLCEEFHVSQSKLKTNFKQITGMSVSSYVNHIRLKSSKVLLETTMLEQAQIAAQCGFSDESYFIETFRKRYAITPGAYRKGLKIKSGGIS